MATVREVPPLAYLFRTVHNLLALTFILQGGIFLRKMPLVSNRFGIQQLWNRCSCSR